MKQLYPFLLALLCSAASAFSQTLAFEKITGLAGNAGLSYVLGDQTGNLYTVTDNNSNGTGRVYRSQDGGGSWQKLNFTCSYMRLAPNGTLFGAQKDKLFRSVDQGQTWTQIMPEFAGYFNPLEITPTGTLLCYSYNQNIYRSQDNGTTWTQNAPPGPPLNKIFAGKDGSFYAFSINYNVGVNGETKVYRSINEGLDWQLVATQPDNMHSEGIIYQTQSGRLLIFHVLNDGFYYSDDHGTTWTEYLQNGLDIEEAQSIMQMPSGRLWVVTYDRHFYSDDDGTTWIQTSQTTFVNSLTALYTTPDGHFWANFEGNLYRANEESLQTWTFASEGMEEPYVLQIKALSDNVLYVATTGGLFRSPDKGAHWTHFYQKPIYDGGYFYEDRFCFDQNGQIILADGFKVWRVDPQTGSRSNITPSNFDPMYDRVWWAFCLPNGNLMVGRDNNDTYISKDNGSSWGPLNGVTNLIQKVEVVTDTLVYMYQLFYQPYRYNPLTGAAKKVEWNYNQPYPPQISTFDIEPSGSIHLSDYDRHCISHDFGASWECHPTADNSYNTSRRMVVNSAGYIFSSGSTFDSQGMYESIDGGQSWNLVYGNANNIDSYAVTSMCMAPSEQLYIASWRRGLYRTVQSTVNQALVKGNVFNDAVAADCDRDTAEQAVVRVKTKLSANGTTYVGISNVYGQFAMPAFSGDLQAAAVPPSNYWAACSKNVAVPPGAAGIVADSLALGIQPLVQCPRMEVSLSAPFFRRCFPSNLTVSYCNTGTQPASNATVEVTLAPFFVFESAGATLLAQDGQKLTFQIGDVGVNHCGEFNILFTVSCTAPLGFTHCSKAHIYPDQDCATTWSGSWLETSAECVGTDLVLTIHNKGAAMQTPTHYQIIGSNNMDSTAIIEKGTVQLPADGTFTKTVATQGGQVFLSVGQESGFPYGTFAGLQAEGCGSTAPGSSFSVQSYSDAYTWTTEYCERNVGSYDPNDKKATPPGFGTADYLPQGQSIDYQIRFQNTGTDTAFTVVVRDELSPWLDLTTLRPLAASAPYLLEINGQELVFRFPKINLPDSNSNEAASHGFLRFAIQPRAGLPDGTEINNSARIYFDFNDPVVTNTTHYTLGLPAVSSTKTPASLPILKVSPNPSDGLGWVELPGTIPEAKGQTLQITDMTGREIHRQPMAGQTEQFYLPKLAPGLYLLTIQAPDGHTLATGKWVKQ